MRKVIVFQHVAHEILGTLNPLLKQQGFRVRYINYEREPDAKPTLEKYNGLIILGGYMGVYEAEQYTHIKTELLLIEEALKKNIPILGICLGAQMLAHVLGADVKKSPEKEVGWCDVELTEEGARDPLLDHFKSREKIFQLHGDTFDIPKSAKHLARSKVCEGQAFRYGEKVYGLQFHLEVDRGMIERWTQKPENLSSAEKINSETDLYLSHSMNLSNQAFIKFIKIFGLKERPPRMRSR